MSTLDKMLIKGIRSFSPDNTHVITFYKPLTLVVGPNGAGKTTIIEALKYGCTGELPPNSRSGQSFIHDPKVAGETETKGQIKLRFRTAAGKDVVCIRSFQLTQKASKMEYKAIESVLQTINSQTGEKVCLSYRCADIDREVPALMGVSKAILENVIFVHQDDANWPLSEPATLKKKFDDIFSATRYTKALEVLKKLHKEKGDEIKTYRLKLDHLQTLKDAAYKLKENIHNDQEKGAQLRSQIQELEKKIGDSQFRVNSLESILQQMKALQDDIRVKMSEREMVRQMKARQYADIEEDLEDTDQELAEWQANFSDKIKLFEKKKADAKGELASIDEMLSRRDKDYVSLTVMRSTLQAAEDAHLQQRKSRDNLIQELFSKYQLGGVGSPPFVEGVAASYVNRVTRRVNELKEDLSHLKDFNAGECAKIWKRYEDINHKYSEALAQSRAKEEEKIMLESTARDLNKKIEDSMFSEDEMMKFEEKASKLDSQIGKLQSKLEEQNFDSVLKEMQVEKFQLQKRSGDLRREQAALAAESEEHIALKMKKGELVNKERSLKNMMGDMKENIRKALKNKVLEAKDFKHEVEDALRKAKEAFDQVSKKSIEAEKEVSGSLSMLQEAKNTHAKLQRDKETKRKFLINKLAAILQLDIDLDSYPVQLQDAIEKKETRKSQHDMADGMRRMFEPFERVARSTHACPCCERPFSPEEEDDFVWKQRTKSSSTGERLRELASHCSIAESKVQNLEKLRPVYEEYQKIVKDHIPCQEQLIEKCKEEYELKRETSDELCTLLATCKMEHDMIADLTLPANTADRLYREIQVLRKEIQDNEDRINSQSQCLRSADELHHEIEQVEEKMESLDRRLQKLTETQMHMKDDLSHLQARCHAAKEDKMRMASKKEELKRWKDELRNIKDKLIENEARFQALYESKEMLQKDKDRILKEHDDLKAEARRQEDMRSAEMHKLELEADSLDGLHSQIQEYISSNQAEKLNATCAQLSKCAAEKDELAQKRIEKTSEISNTTELLAKQEKVKRNIEDNISYRQSVAKERDLLGQVESLEQQLTTMGDESSLQTDVKKALGDKQASLSELNRNQGTLLVYDSNVARNKQELKQPQYKDIDKRYREQLIQLKTTEMANKDLGKYYNALDRALMRFHSMKMEEINKIIKELWQQTYRGQDIDFIEIRADAEGAGTRSYSYRVIMRTGDAELEMRGRCSAGQKVLAALIIRLALAETFCLNCGILALDEPTTNLDAQNSESLAAALLRIMEDRKGQENFQLIVITHDEKFAQLIGQRQLAERYYRVSKDDYQHSIIEAQEIYD